MSTIHVKHDDGAVAYNSRKDYNLELSNMKNRFHLKSFTLVPATYGEMRVPRSFQRRWYINFPVINDLARCDVLGFL